MKDLAKKGIGIIFISHRLDEVFSVADRILVLKDGESVGTRNARDITRTVSSRWSGAR